MLTILGQHTIGITNAITIIEKEIRRQPFIWFPNTQYTVYSHRRKCCFSDAISEITTPGYSCMLAIRIIKYTTQTFSTNHQATRYINYSFSDIMCYCIVQNTDGG